VQIAVVGARGAVDSRTRAYVAYRLFDTFRSVEREIRAVDVSLSNGTMRVPPVVTCTIAIELITGEQMTVNATAEWPYAAVDRAVEEAWTRVSNGSLDAIRS
jgi:ribosome-associated translation inhibitor RaiA